MIRHNDKKFQTPNARQKYSPVGEWQMRALKSCLQCFQHHSLLRGACLQEFLTGLEILVLRISNGTHVLTELQWRDNNVFLLIQKFPC